MDRGLPSVPWKGRELTGRAYPITHDVLFDPLLWNLLDIVPEPPRPVGAMGRTPIPLRTQLLMAVKKVHLGESTRRAQGLLRVVYGSGTGCIGKVPNYAVPSRLFNRPDAGGLLLDLIRSSAQPLRELEDDATVAVDSSGFCTTCMGSYCTEKHDPGRKHRWVKAHVIIGVKAHVVLDVIVTDENGADCPQFAKLLAGVKSAGFTPEIVVADKAYLSHENFRLVDEFGATAYIPFKVNSISNEVRRIRGVKTPPAWDRAYHLFQANREQFAAKYHQRSNVEATFSAIKRKLGESLLSKNPLARFNELLAKILAYNIGVIVHEIHEHGIDPAFVGLGGPSTGQGAPHVEMDQVAVRTQPSCDSIDHAVTEVAESLE
ncbi:MAG: transposase [Thermoplasmata archaeon]